ncbi:MauE/DoxX family redox-associated membrane protein [Calidifontibacter indicus]|uniref:MauE/DoxX family redox-associated membrane protein n=1 Tax=Calidifontibacter indicus TaxID=419650 RepID=UPI003D75BE50
MQAILIIALSVFLSLTFAAPAIGKIRKFHVLVAYHSAMWEIGRVSACGILAAVICMEFGLSALILIRLYPVAIGAASGTLILAFAAFRVALFRRTSGTSSCTCSGELTESDRITSAGGIAGTLALLVPVALWTAL